MAESAYETQGRRWAWLTALCSLCFVPGQAAAFQSVLPLFHVQSYMGRCLDVGATPLQAGSAVFIDDCGSPSGQDVGVEEFVPPVTKAAAPTGGLVPPRDHQVRLHVAGFCIGASASQPASGAPVQLLPCSFSAGQIFVLDGDSIILDSNRDLVVQLRSGATPRHTPLVLAHRLLSDVEFWDFIALDGSQRKPTSLFVSVSNATVLQQALERAIPNTVIEVAPGALISFTGLPEALPLKTGVTLRGDRRGESMGPQISLSVDSGIIPVASFPRGEDFTAFLEAVGTNVRVTSLRIRGPSRDFYGHQHGVAGILSDITSESMRIVIDRNDMSDWTRSAIDLYSYLGELRTCQPPVARSQNFVIARNFIHHNRQSDNDQHDSDGYGVAAGWGSDPMVYGNEFLENVHCITSDGSTFAGYSALDNLFLSTEQSANVDVHGSGASHDGGVAGGGVEVLRNTFLDPVHYNFSVRGYPCAGAVDSFRENVALHTIDSTVEWQGGGSPPPYLRIDSKFFPVDPNQAPSALTNPTRRFGVGDFDGDGKQDLFLATGAAWYYAPAGAAEWRLLSEQTETLNNLLFGDFDADGRTDVFTQVGENWMVSWGGRTPWVRLSNRHNDWLAPGTGNGSHSMFDFYIGDFVGDNRADVFYADGTNWYVSDAGVGPFVLYAVSGFQIPDLAFGHFDPNVSSSPKTDVVGVVANQWMAVFARQEHAWKPLRPKLTDTMAGLFVADFNGDHIDDIAQIGGFYRVSINGAGGWTALGCGFNPPVAVGQFDGLGGADILGWGGNELQICPSGTGPSQQRSRQDMR